MNNFQSHHRSKPSLFVTRLARAACMTALVAISATPAWAEPGGGGSVSGVVIHIAADNGVNSAEWQGLFDESAFNEATGIYDWSLAAPVVLMDGLVPVATLNEADLFYDVDPEVQLGFNVNAGGVATSFTITSALVSFGALFEPEAAATAAVSVTDVGGNGNASLTGGYAGGTKSYIANYNGLAPGGTNFATLVDNVGPFGIGSQTESETKPFEILFGTSVTDISSQFKFTLSAGDQASGTSTFVIRENPIPEPGTAIFLAIGGLALAHRRARRRAAA